VPICAAVVPADSGRVVSSAGEHSLVLSLSKDEHTTVMQFWTYMLACSDGSYYVGHTDDLAARLASHEDGTFGGYTSKRRPVTLIYAEVYDSREDAFRRERQLKVWSRAKKEALAREDWCELKRLAKTAHPSTGAGERG
jgi:predicted GIY-YIG superfamily endonuclease